MQLFTFDGAPNPRRVNLFIRYKGIEIPTRQINLREGEQLGEEYRRINPRCIVPALQLDDGSVLCEGVAICWYLESLYPQRPLMGVGAQQQAQVLSWDHLVFADGLMPVAEALRNRSAAFKDRALPGPGSVPQIPELELRGRQRLQLFWQYLDAHLQGREFILGNALTLADIDAFTVIDFAGWIKERVPDSCTNLNRWAAHVKSLLT